MHEDSIAHIRRAATALMHSDPEKVQFRVREADEPSAAAAGFDGLLVIDGVMAQAGVLRQINPDQIESVDVIKGRRALELYDDPRAANGVIRITTKNADRTR